MFDSHVSTKEIMSSSNRPSTFSELKFCGIYCVMEISVLDSAHGDLPWPSTANRVMLFDAIIFYSIQYYACIYFPQAHHYKCMEG